MKRQNAAPDSHCDPLSRSAVGIATSAFFGWIALLATVPITDASFRYSSLFLGCNVALAALCTYVVASLAGPLLLRSTIGALAFSALLFCLAAPATYFFDVYAACELNRGLCL